MNGSFKRFYGARNSLTASCTVKVKGKISTLDNKMIYMVSSAQHNSPVWMISNPAIWE